MSDPQINSKLSVFILILLVIFCPLGIDLYLPAFPAMQSGLAVSNAHIQQTVGIYMLTVGLGQLIAGPLADKYGRRPIALSGIFLFALGGLLAANTNDWCVIMAARALQGFGACATFVTAFAIDIYYLVTFFLFATVFLLPFLVLELFLVRWPRSGRPDR